MDSNNKFPYQYDSLELCIRDVGPIILLSTLADGGGLERHSRGVLDHIRAALQGLPLQHDSSTIWGIHVLDRSFR